MIQHRKPSSTGQGLPVLGVRLEIHLRDWVREKAKKRKVSESQVVRELIEKAMGEESEETTSRKKANKV